MRVHGRLLLGGCGGADHRVARLPQLDLCHAKGRVLVGHALARVVANKARLEPQRKLGVGRLECPVGGAVLLQSLCRRPLPNTEGGAQVRSAEMAG